MQLDEYKKINIRKQHEVIGSIEKLINPDIPETKIPITFVIGIFVFNCSVF